MTTKTTMTITPVFDGGACTLVRDGVLVFEGGKWIISDRKQVGGWYTVREATAAEIATGNRLYALYRADHRKHQMEVTL